MEIRSLGKVLVQLHEVVADHSPQLAAIEEDEELGLNSSVEVELDKGGGIAVYSDVLNQLNMARSS